MIILSKGREIWEGISVNHQKRELNPFPIRSKSWDSDLVNFGDGMKMKNTFWDFSSNLELHRKFKNSDFFLKDVA